MSVSDDAEDIIRLTNAFEKTSAKKEHRAIVASMSEATNRITGALTGSSQAALYEQVILDEPPQQSVPVPIKKRKKVSKKKLIDELHIDEEALARLYKKKKKKGDDLDVAFTVYVPSAFGAVANRTFGGYAQHLTKKGATFEALADNVKVSGLNILSRTYVSMVLFGALLGAIGAGLLALVVMGALGVPPLMLIVGTVAAIIAGGGLVFGVMYAYPASESSRKSKAIKKDLPFAIIHMAAVAGSGAQPLAMFKLLLRSDEYKGLESEIKKIVNYVNLFGYDLSTALKNVSLRTPSKEWKELLNGIAATIESGGSLKAYLKSIADDTMATYRLERKKYVETLATYSDIYTGVLIAAPLLFMVALTIINMMGGTIAGISIATLAWGGTFVVLPVVNVLFYLFLNITQPEE